MTRKFTKIAVVIFMLAVSVVSAASVLAGPLKPETVDEITAKTDVISTDGGFESADSNSAAEIVATVIKGFLSILGVVFVILVVIAGYNYMTASGDESKIEKAINTMQRAIIGLLIIVAAYAITAFIFKNLPAGAGGSGSSIQGGPIQ